MKYKTCMYPILFLLTLSLNTHAATFDCSPVNSGFEQPPVLNALPASLASYNGGTIKAYHQTDVPSWSTAASDFAIEIWHNTNTLAPISTSHSGAQFAELNANEATSMYTDIATTPNTVFSWSIAHRGRKQSGVPTGTDSASVNIGTSTSQTLQQTMTTGPANWVVYSGNYLVPAGQTTTRFQIDHISAAGIDVQGNLLDSVTFSCEVPKIPKVPTLSSTARILLILSLLLMTFFVFRRNHNHT